jgi:hypothetical protein
MIQRVYYQSPLYVDWPENDLLQIFWIASTDDKYLLTLSISYNVQQYRIISGTGNSVYWFNLAYRLKPAFECSM